ncbi:MAG: hypothetical protein ACP5OO_12725 [Chloroflexia bacterium]
MMAMPDLHGVSAEVFRESVLAWVACRRQSGTESPAYALSAIAPQPTLMSLCFAVLTAELFGALPEAAERVRTVQVLTSAQDAESGLFVDPCLTVDDLEPTSPGIDYLLHQTTYFALNALDALSARPSYSLRFADPYLQPAFLEGWLRKLDWSNPWKECNRAMFIATALYTRYCWWNDPDALAALHGLLDWLDQHQDPDTGLWGTREGASLLHAMAGAYHLLPFYFALRRPIYLCEKILASTLSLQRPDGLFHPQGGGDACLDVDAVGILAWCSLTTPNRAAQVQMALGRAFQGILANWSEEGGFCRARLRSWPAKSWRRRIAEMFGLDRILRKPYRRHPQVMYYEGWRKMPFDIRQPDLWSTWFRSYGLAVVSTRLPGTFLDGVPWRFRRLPGLGWYDEAAIMDTYAESYPA